MTGPPDGEPAEEGLRMTSQGERLHPSAAAVLERELADRGCDALLVVAGSSRDPDLAPFVGPVHLGRSFLLLPRSGSDGATPRLGFLTPMERGEAAQTGLELLTPAALDVERWLRERPEPARFWGAVLGRALELAGVSGGRVALAGHLGAGHAVGLAAELAGAGHTLVDGHEVVRLLRKRKQAHEIDGIRAAAAGTVAAFRQVAALLARAEAAEAGADSSLAVDGAPLTIGRLRERVFRVLADHRLEQPEGNIIAPGEEGALPHSIGTDERVLRQGESLVVDLFPRGLLFADCTRTFCVGEPPEPLARAHGLVLEALRRARAAARPGVRGWSLQEETCAILGDGGFPTPISHPGTERGYVHNLGHGVGHELHEYPSFRKQAGAEGVLREGDVITLEPGLYEPDEGWGLRLEDLLVLGADGIAEDLTPLPYDLDPRAW
jgi:Xaa-Pro aminopeptidase